MTQNAKDKKWLRVLKKLLLVSAWVIMIGGVVTALAFVDKQEKELKCKKVFVSLYPLDVHFFNRQRVLEVIRKGLNSEKKLIGMPLEEINIPKFERELKRQVYTQDAEVYADMHGIVNIRVRQRIPILRLMRFDGTEYYLDQTGYKMPLSEHFTAHVPFANGNIFERYEKGDSVYSFVGNQLYQMALYVDKDPFLKAFIEQIFVRADNELVLIPKVGNAYIIFGDTKNLEVKFEKLLVFCKEGLNRIGWNKYRSIDLRFEGQVICKK
jgi:cell division protein FtsQ